VQPHALRIELSTKDQKQLHGLISGGVQQVRVVLRAVALLQLAKGRLIAMVCHNPPVGRARWTVRLVAEEAVKRKLVPRVGRETIRILLLSHDLKPWREKNVGGGRPR
jgi:hypothetical protein